MYSSKKQTRLLLFVWSFILITSVLIVGNVFSTTSYIGTETSGAPLQEEYQSLEEYQYQGPEFCKTCHPDQYAMWNATVHANATNASNTRTNNQTYDEGKCYSCHSTSQAGAKFFEVNATNTPVYEGVSCESCHGPYQGGGYSDHMPTTLSAELCGSCHSPYHEEGHGAPFEAWNTSLHSAARDTLLESEFEEQPRCVHCMTAEGVLPWPMGGVELLTNLNMQ